MPINCYTFGNDYKTFLYDKYAAFNGQVGDIILAFIFKLMGNSLKFKQAMDDITNDLKN